MNNTVVIVIDGRPALPLRALPYVTAWAEAPDSIVRALALKPTVQVGKPIQGMAGRRIDIMNRQALRACRMNADGTWAAIPHSQWGAVDVELSCLTKRLQVDERQGAEGENHARWRVEATLVLPDDAFVWADEFERWFKATRPLVVPTDDDLELWQIEQARLYEGEDLAMVLKDGMTEFDRVGRLDFVVVLPVELDGKIWRRCTVASAVAPPTSTQATSKKRRGRPRTIDKRASAISVIMGHFASVGIWDNPMALPGNCANLFEACKRIEKLATGKAATIGGSEDQFRSVLNEAGFNFRPGRRRNCETCIWTRVGPQIAAKIDAKIFAEISHPA